METTTQRNRTRCLCLLPALMLCGACETVVVAQEPVRMTGYRTLYEGRCQGARFALQVRDPTNVRLNEAGVTVDFSGRRRNLGIDSPLAALLAQRPGVTRVTLRCSARLRRPTVSVYTTTALASGGYLSAEARIDDQLNIEVLGPYSTSQEDFEGFHRYQVPITPKPGPEPIGIP